MPALLWDSHWVVPPEQKSLVNPQSLELVAGDRGSLSSLPGAWETLYCRSLGHAVEQCQTVLCMAVPAPTPTVLKNQNLLAIRDGWEYPFP